MADPEVEITKQLTNVLEQWKNHETKNCLLHNRICNNILTGVLILFFFAINLCVGIATGEVKLFILLLFSTFCSTTYIVILFFKLKELQEEAISHGNEFHFVMGMFESLMGDYRINTTLYYYLKRVSFSNMNAVSFKSKLHKFLLELICLNVGIFYLVNLQSKDTKIYFKLMAILFTLILVFIIFQYGVLIHDFKNFAKETVKKLTSSIENFKMILKSSSELVRNNSKVSEESMEIRNYQNNAEFLRNQVENVTAFRCIEKIMEKPSDIEQPRNEVLQEFTNKRSLITIPSTMNNSLENSCERGNKTKSLEIGNNKQTRETNEPEKFEGLQDNFKAPVNESELEDDASQLYREHENSYCNNLNSQDQETENDIYSEQIEGIEKANLKEDSSVISDEPQLEDKLELSEEYEKTCSSHFGNEEQTTKRGFNVCQVESIENIKEDYSVPANKEQEIDRGITIHHAESIENIKEHYNQCANEEQENEREISIHQAESTENIKEHYNPCANEEHENERGISVHQAESIENIKEHNNPFANEKQENEREISIHQAENIENIKEHCNPCANEEQENERGISIDQAESSENIKDNYNAVANEEQEIERGVNMCQIESIKIAKEDYYVSTNEELDTEIIININHAENTENVSEDYNVPENESQIQDTLDNYKEDEENQCNNLIGTEGKTENATSINQTVSIENVEEDSNVLDNESQLKATIIPCKKHEKNHCNTINNEHRETKNAIERKQTEVTENFKGDSNADANELQHTARVKTREEFERGYCNSSNDAQQQLEKVIDIKQAEDMENVKVSNLPANESLLEATVGIYKESEENICNNFNGKVQETKNAIDAEQVEGTESVKADLLSEKSQLEATSKLSEEYEKVSFIDVGAEEHGSERGINISQTESNENVKGVYNIPTNDSQLQDKVEFCKEYEKNHCKNFNGEEHQTKNVTDVNQAVGSESVKDNTYGPANESHVEATIEFCKGCKKYHRSNFIGEYHETENMIDAEQTGDIANVDDDSKVPASDSQLEATLEPRKEYEKSLSSDMGAEEQESERGINAKRPKSIENEKKDSNVLANESQCQDCVEFCEEYKNNHCNNFNGADQQIKQETDKNQAEGIENVKEDSNVPTSVSQLITSCGLSTEYKNNQCNNFIEKDPKTERGVDEEQREDSENVKDHCNDPTRELQIKAMTEFYEENVKYRSRDISVEEPVTGSEININEPEGIKKQKEDSKVPCNESHLEANLGLYEDYKKNRCDNLNNEDQKTKNATDAEVTDETENLEEDSDMLVSEPQLEVADEFRAEHANTCSSDFGVEEQRIKSGINKNQAEGMENGKETILLHPNGSQLQDVVELCKKYAKNHCNIFIEEGQQIENITEIKQTERTKNVKQGSKVLHESQLKATIEACEDCEKDCQSNLGVEQETEAGINKKLAECIKNAKEDSTVPVGDLQQQAITKICEAYEKTRKIHFRGEEQKKEVGTKINQANEAIENVKEDSHVSANYPQLQVTTELFERYENTQRKGFEVKEQQTENKRQKKNRKRRKQKKQKNLTNQAEDIENIIEYFNVPTDESQLAATVEPWEGHEKPQRNVIGNKEKQMEIRSDANQVEYIKNVNEYSDVPANELQYETTVKPAEGYKKSLSNASGGEKQQIEIRTDFNQAEGSKNMKQDSDVITNDSQLQAPLGLGANRGKNISFFLFAKELKAENGIGENDNMTKVSENLATAIPNTEGTSCMSHECTKESNFKMLATPMRSKSGNSYEDANNNKTVERGSNVFRRQRTKTKQTEVLEDAKRDDMIKDTEPSTESKTIASSSKEVEIKSKPKYTISTNVYQNSSPRNDFSVSFSDADLLAKNVDLHKSESEEACVSFSCTKNTHSTEGLFLPSTDSTIEAKETSQVSNEKMMASNSQESPAASGSEKSIEQHFPSFTVRFNHNNGKQAKKKHPHYRVKRCFSYKHFYNSREGVHFEVERISNKVSCKIQDFKINK